MKKLEDIINEAVKAALKADVVPPKKEKEEKEETVDEDVCDECGGDLILVEEHRAVCEKCGAAYEI